MLELKGISKSFLLAGKEAMVLRDIELSINTHEFVCIIGPSGCGKSTLLELIAGITYPDGGTISKDGKEITGRPGNAGYMPQDDLLLPWLNLLDNAILPARLSGKDLKQARSKVMSLLPDFDLTGYHKHMPWQLSGGMKQRTAFLRTIMTEADLLLLDEPFANLDALTRLQMQKWLLNLRIKLNQTILMVTHDIDEAIRLADRIYVMDSVPGPFAEVAIVPEILHTEDGENSPLWMELKHCLTQKLIK